MAVRSRRLDGPQRLVNGAYQTIYTVSAGRTAIVRQCWAANVSGSASVNLNLRLNATTGVGLLLDTVLVGGQTLILQSFVMNPGDVLYGRANTTGGNIDFSMFGALLLGEPE